MSLSKLLSQTGTLAARSFTGAQDEYGTPTWETVTSSVACHIQPKTSVELSGAGGEDVGQTEWKGFLPTGTTVEAHDSLTVDGVVYEIQGPGRPWLNPRRGVESHVEVDLRRTNRTASAWAFSSAYSSAYDSEAAHG